MHEILAFFSIVFFVEPSTLKKHLQHLLHPAVEAVMVIGLANPLGDTNLNTSVKHQHQHHQQRTPSNCLLAYTEQIADTFPIVPPPLSQRTPWPALDVTRRPPRCLAPD